MIDVAESWRGLMAVVLGAAVVAAAGCGSSPLATSCGTGTHADHGLCVVDITCGPGTTMLGGVCLASTDGGTACGPGTQSVGGQCMAVPADAGGGVACGQGTVLVGGQCVPIAFDAGPAIGCGAGTHLVGNQCLPDATDAGPPVTCAAGTHLANGQCVADPVDAGVPIGCGPGTHLVGDHCLPTPDGGQAQFFVRVGVTTIGADGYSSIPVVVLGTDENGNPSTATVVLDTSRAGAGTVSPSTVTLTPTGATVYFTPCSAAASMWCAGPMHITLALASAPGVVVAESQEITLVAPTGVGSDSPCLAGGNVAFFNGDPGDYIFSGMQTMTQGQWSASASSGLVHISLTPADESQGLWWDFYFETTQIPAPITTQVYEGAERWPFESPGHPGLDVSGDGRGCNTVTGRFQVEDLVESNGSLTSFTATFEHHCEGGTPALRGCVHFGM
jgi:hypothetical protein